MLSWFFFYQSFIVHMGNMHRFYWIQHRDMRMIMAERGQKKWKSRKKNRRKGNQISDEFRTFSYSHDSCSRSIVLLSLSVLVLYSLPLASFQMPARRDILCHLCDRKKNTITMFQRFNIAWFNILTNKSSLLPISPRAFQNAIENWVFMVCAASEMMWILLLFFCVVLCCVVIGYTNGS